MAEITFEIIEEIGIIAEKSKGWRTEINLVSWNSGKAKYDIRDWSPKREKMGKGITLSYDEIKQLKEILNKWLD